MNPLAIILAIAAIISVGVFIFTILRRSSVPIGPQNLRENMQCGAGDAYSHVNDASEDLKDQVKEVAK